MPKSPLRILHLPVIVLNQANLYTRALRELGHRCDFLLYDVPADDIHVYEGCDINLGLTAKGYLERIRTVTGYIRKSLQDYDIYHFHSGRTFIPLMAFSRWRLLPQWFARWVQFLDFMDLPYLRRKGKKIVFQFWGCDIRDPHFDLPFPESACRLCPPELQKIHCNRNLKLKMDRLTLKYADARLCAGDLNLHYKDLVWVENAIDTSYWKPLPPDEIPGKYRIDKRDRIYVYHSFNKSDERSDVKGTSYILEALEQLKREGHKIELLFFNYTPHDELRYYQMQADIVVDQLRSGDYGNTAVECMSMGKPVIGFIRPELERLMPTTHPIIKANIQNITAVLRELITNSELRQRVGQESREYAEKIHDLKVVGKKLEHIYYDLMN